MNVLLIRKMRFVLRKMLAITYIWAAQEPDPAANVYCAETTELSPWNVAPIEVSQFQRRQLSWCSDSCRSRFISFHSLKIKWITAYHYAILRWPRIVLPRATGSFALCELPVWINQFSFTDASRGLIDDIHLFHLYRILTSEMMGKMWTEIAEWIASEEAAKVSPYILIDSSIYLKRNHIANIVRLKYEIVNNFVGSEGMDAKARTICIYLLFRSAITFLMV